MYCLVNILCSLSKTTMCLTSPRSVMVLSVAGSSGCDAASHTSPLRSLMAVERPPKGTGPREKGCEKMVVWASSWRICAERTNMTGSAGRTRAGAVA